MWRISDCVICTTSTIRAPEATVLLRHDLYNKCAVVLFSANIRIFPVLACHNQYPPCMPPVKALRF